THPNVALIDGKEYLIYSSDCPEGQGNLDIWYAEILDANTFGKPQNAGKKINSPDPEVSPFYHSSSKTLYFSSTWHNGFGGFDVFKATGVLNSLSEPENMMPPINTSWNDLYYTLDSTGYSGFL